MAGSALPAIRNGYQQPSGDHANGRGLPNDDIRHRVTEIRCCGTENRFSKLTISTVSDRAIMGTKIGIRPAAEIPARTNSCNGCWAKQIVYQYCFVPGGFSELVSLTWFRRLVY